MLAERQSQTQAGRRSGERGLCAAAQINEILCFQRVEAMLRARVCYSTPDQPITKIARNTIVPIPSSQTALRAGPLWSEQWKGLTRIEAQPLNLGGVSANDTRSGLQPRSDAARLLCPRLPSSILILLFHRHPRLSRAFVIRQISTFSHHSNQTSHSGLPTISFASASPGYQPCGTAELIQPITAPSRIILRDPFSQGPFCDLATSDPSYTSTTSTCLLSDLFPQPSPSRRSVPTKRTKKGLFLHLPLSSIDSDVLSEHTLLHLAAVTAVSKQESSQLVAHLRFTRDAQADLFV